MLLVSYRIVGYSSSLNIHELTRDCQKQMLTIFFTRKHFIITMASPCLLLHTVPCLANLSKINDSLCGCVTTLFVMLFVTKIKLLLEDE